MGDGYTLSQVEELLAYLITHNYTCDGGQVRRQIQGMPMGMPAAPQIANLSCYPVEKAHAYALGPGNSLVVCRYIDDLYSAVVPLPPSRGLWHGVQEDCGGGECCVPRRQGIHHEIR